MRQAVTLLAVLALCGGCTSARGAFHATDDSLGYAAPGPDLVGTWRGTAFAVGGSLYHVSTPVELKVKPDGTWTWSMRGQVQGEGRLAFRRSDIILAEDWARKGSTQSTNAPAEQIELKRRGEELWGVTRAFIPGAQSAIELKRVGS